MDKSDKMLEKVMSVAQLRTRARSRRRRGKNKNVVFVKGKARRVTSKMRAAFRKGGRRVARMSKSKTIQKRAGRTKMKHSARMGGKAYSGASFKESIQHNPAFVLAAAQYAARTGEVDTATALIEETDQALTNTAIGMYAMEIGEKLDKNTTISGIFADVAVIDEKTLAFFFERSEAVTESTLERELSDFGEVDVLAKPGDAISEDEVSDMYVVAVTVSDAKIKPVKEAFDKINNPKTDENGNVVLDETVLLSDEQIEEILADPAFTELTKELV